MNKFVFSDRTQPYLLPPDLREWLPEDDLAHFVVAAVERVPMSAFRVNSRGTGSAQYHPRLMLALLIYCYANGIFSSRRIERATYRDIGVRYVTGNTHPDHDTICKFRRENLAAVPAAAGTPDEVLADNGYATETEVDELTRRGMEVLVAVGGGDRRRHHDFRPERKDKPPKAATAPWLVAMQEKLAQKRQVRQIGRIADLHGASRPQGCAQSLPPCFRRGRLCGCKQGDGRNERIKRSV